jgi:serine/threonine-protein kinase HipA
MPAIEPTLLQLKFLGGPFGVLAYRPDGPVHALELDREFLASGHDLSPLSLPAETFAAGPRLFRPGDTPFAAGLPGLSADSLPDAWGERMLQNEIPGLQTVLGKLAAIGQRGPGAITYEPVLGAGADRDPTTANLAGLARDADALRASPVPLSTDRVNAALARGGSSLGGAFPKTSAHLRLEGDFIERRDILVGGPTPAGYASCILKFARSTDEAEGAVEFAFWLMAKNAGIRVPKACLVFDGERRHFASERFDRYRRPDDTMARRHVHSLSGMMHRRASDGAIDYEDFMRLSRRLGGANEAIECFRRAVFNLLATNRDDHGRNHVFLYDETARTWALAPAFDLNPSVSNVLIALTWLGSAQIPTQFTSLIRLAEIGAISAKMARDIYKQVESATVGGWREAAGRAEVPPAMITYWDREIVQQTRALRADAKAPVKTRNRRSSGTSESIGN